MKKILFTVYTYSLGGGAERILSDVVNHLNPAKYDITILPYADYHVMDEQVNDNVKLLPGIVDMENTGRIERIMKYFLVHFLPSMLRKRYIREKYDVEISFNYQIPSFLVMGEKVIQWNHGDNYDLRDKWLKRQLQKRSYKRADKIVVISANTRQSVFDIFPKYADKVQLIYNGVNIDRILKKSEENTDIVLKENSIVFLGRLEEAKQPLKLLEAVKNLVCAGKDIHLYYLGRGEQADEIECQIKQGGLQEHVFLLGYQKNPYPIIKQCKAVCMMSKAEGFPTVFTEGMALGKPFISSKVGGVEELSNCGECGIIVDDVKQCEEAIEKIVLNDEVNRKMGETCQIYIENYSLKKQIETIEHLLDTI